MHINDAYGIVRSLCRACCISIVRVITLPPPFPFNTPTTVTTSHYKGGGGLRAMQAFIGQCTPTPSQLMTVGTV